jgi:hypothetical protein
MPWDAKRMICAAALVMVLSLYKAHGADGVIRASLFKSYHTNLFVMPTQCRGFTRKADPAIPRVPAFQHDAARDYIFASLVKMGLKTRYDRFHFYTNFGGPTYVYSNCYNIVAVLPGKNPAAYGTWIVSAFYDTVDRGQPLPTALTNGTAAKSPGADLNASGVAAVLCVADALKKRDLMGTVYFILFDASEKNFGGAYAFVERKTTPSAVTNTPPPVVPPPVVPPPVVTNTPPPAVTNTPPPVVTNTPPPVVTNIITNATASATAGKAASKKIERSNIRFMISLDTVAYNPPGDEHDMAMIWGGAAKPTQMRRKLGKALAAYGGIKAVQGGSINSSDHVPFWQAGIDACVLSERNIWSNPYIYTTADTITKSNYMDYGFGAAISRGVAGFLAAQAGPAVWLDVSTSGDGTVKGPAGWIRQGEQVELIAKPALNRVFKGWKGDVAGCTIMNNKLVATMDRSRAITAAFASP